MRPLLLLALVSCSSTLKSRAKDLGPLSLATSWAKDSGPAPLDTKGLSAAFVKGAVDASVMHWLPFGLEPGAKDAAVLAIHFPSPRIWRGENGSVILELPVTATVRDKKGESLDERKPLCFDEGIPAPTVLVPDDYEPPPPPLAEARTDRGPTKLAAWDDLQRAYEALAEWCGGQLIEQMSRDLR